MIYLVTRTFFLPMISLYTFNIYVSTFFIMTLSLIITMEVLKEFILVKNK